MMWEKVKIGEICNTCLGKMLDKAKNRGELRPYLANLNVRWGEFETSNLSLMKFEDNELDRYGIKYGDLIMCEGGEIGRCAIWKEAIPNMMIQKALHRIRPKDERLNIFYLFYWFMYQGLIGGIDQYASGTTTIKHLPAVKLKEIEIDLPPRPIQDKISSILSAYDEMIDNCKAQIALLEEAAQRLYHEWFVDLRFPSSETTPIGEDGLPEGWSFIKVGDLLQKTKNGKSIKSTEYKTSGVLPVIDQSRNFIAGYTNDREAKVNMPLPIILFGDHTRVLKFIDFDFARGADGTQLICSNNESQMPMCLLYLSLINVDLSNYSYARHFKYLKEEKIVLPTKDVAQEFERIVSNYFHKINLMRQTFHNALIARDILLPRLISGQIEINV